MVAIWAMLISGGAFAQQQSSLAELDKNKAYNLEEMKAKGYSVLKYSYRISVKNFGDSEIKVNYIVPPKMGQVKLDPPDCFAKSGDGTRLSDEMAAAFGGNVRLACRLKYTGPELVLPLQFTLPMGKYRAATLTGPGYNGKSDMDATPQGQNLTMMAKLKRATDGIFEAEIEVTTEGIDAPGTK